MAIEEKPKNGGRLMNCKELLYLLELLHVLHIFILDCELMPNFLEWLKEGG